MVKSPVTLLAVLNISRNLSIPAIIAIASIGIPTDVKTIVIITKATEGTPAAPMLPIVAVIEMITYSARESSRPISCEIKIAESPKYIAEPSILTVAPIGTTKDETSLRIPKFLLAVFKVKGIVAELLEEKKAKIIGSFIFLKKSYGLHLVTNLTMAP